MRLDRPASPDRTMPAVWRIVAAASGLSLAGVAAPIAVAVLAATTRLLGPPLAASALIALLVVAPASVGLATALSGLRRIAAATSAGDGEAEGAVLRVFVVAIVFFYALGLVAVTANDAAAAWYLAAAALWLVAAWAILLHVILWPAVSPVRRYGAIAVDAALLSAFLHFGGRAVAGWYPLYLAATLYAGMRFGRAALFAGGAASVAGFAAVAVSTAAWHQQPGLAIGLTVALALLPALVAGKIGTEALAHAVAAQSDAERRYSLRLIADGLRRTLVGIAPGSGQRPVLPPMAAAAIGDLADFAALEIGSFAAPVEVFDLRALVKRSLAPLSEDGDGRAVLRWRVDPALPFRVRGRARAFARLLVSLARQAFETAAGGTVRLGVDGEAAEGGAVELRIWLEGGAVSFDAQPDLPLATLPIRPLLTLLDGYIAAAPGGRRMTVGLTLEAADIAADLVLDLRRRPVLVASEDSQLAEYLLELLDGWNAAARWLGDPDDAVAELPRLETEVRPIMIADGRFRLLPALSLAHYTARLAGAAPFVLLLAEREQIDGLGEVDAGEIDGFVPMPVTAALLANALHALPLGPDRPVPVPDEGGQRPGKDSAPARSGAPPPAERITPIATHPKFASDSAAPVDASVVDRLRALGGGPAFLHEVVDSFRADASLIIRRLEEAAASADPARFARSLLALRRAAGNLGGVQLCDLAASLQGLTPAELRQHGAAHVRRIETEIERLALALGDHLPAAEAGQS